ncbi:MAG: DUF4013 domain-containing protein [archaeon]
MVDFIEAVKRPLRADPVTIAMGVIFGIFPFTRPLLHGLGIEAARRTFTGNTEMPGFDDFIDAFLSGLVVLVITILFFLPALGVLALGAAAAFPLVMDILRNIPINPSVSVQALMTLVVGGAIFGSVALLLSLLAAIMLPVAVQLYAHDKHVSSAFSFRKIFRVVATAPYWIATVLMMGYGIALLGLVSVISLPEFNALSVVFLGIAFYMWWMTWYIVMSQVVHESGVLGHTKHAHETTTKRKKKR